MPWRGETTLQQSSERIASQDRQRRSIDRTQGRVIPRLEDMAIGEAREYTLAVSHIDINNFKATSQSMSVSNLMRFVSIFLTEMTYIVRDWSGAVEKYVGDQVTALFGVGSQEPEAAINCLYCNLSMLTIIRYAINPYMQSQGLPQITCSVGMDLGETWIEKVGIVNQNQFTLVGHAVNIAAELQEMAAPNGILLGDRLYQALPNEQKNYCVLQNRAQTWTWTYRNSGNSYPYYRYNAIWGNYSLS
jgi:class 3 adenylate cyclase